jgi:hypothetical protein
MIAKTDSDIYSMAARNAKKASKLSGNHPHCKLSEYFTNSERDAVLVVVGTSIAVVAAEWIEGVLSWVLGTRHLHFRDGVDWQCVGIQNIEGIDWGDFKGHDKAMARRAAVRADGKILGFMTYGTGASSMVPMNALLTIQRLR